MKKKFIIVVAVFAIASMIFSISFPGCGTEELESCPPCGLFMAGAINISGDPRLDGTIEAVQRLKVISSEIERNFDADVAALAAEFNMEISSQPPSPDDVAAIVQKINDSLPSVSFALEPVECWVGVSLAASAVLACQESLPCLVTSDCREDTNRRASCSGLCVGGCSGGCSQNCYIDDESLEDTDAQIGCGAGCIGVCTDSTCPGICVGKCDGQCTSFDSAGNCMGYCSGRCEGACDSPVPYPCEGQCIGKCLRPSEMTIICEGQCRDTCTGIGFCSGRCRGHARPEGCESMRCEDKDLEECREMAKGLAWSAISCDPIGLHMGLETDSQAERGEIVLRAKLVEQVLTRVAVGHAKLSLLIDGIDAAGELETDDLVEDLSDTDDPFVLEYLDSDYEDSNFLKEAKVVNERRFLPLSNLKARIWWLIDQSTSGDYRVTTGTINCIGPAFQDAHAVLDTMIPVNADATAPDRSGGLYRVLDGQAALLEIVQNNPVK